MTTPVFSLILLAHHPFVGLPRGERRCHRRNSGFRQAEIPFFEAVSQTYLPLLQLFFRLEQHRVPFRLGMVFSPVLCSMLQDECLLLGYQDYLDKRIEFGRKEVERSSQDPGLQALARYYYEEDVERRIFFTEYCERDILAMFRRFQKKGRLEILTTAASYAFLPLYASIPEGVRPQIEAAVVSHRRIFGKSPQGFWLPELGWSGELEEVLSSYGFSYTVTDAHAFVLGVPPARKGIFYPVKSASGFIFLGRDAQARCEITSFLDVETAYQRHYTDAGFELSIKALRPFVGERGSRCSTGYRYRRLEQKETFYDPEKACDQAREHARHFLAARISRLEEATSYMKEAPLCLCALNAGDFGQDWYEGTAFLEALFREIAGSGQLNLAAPGEYIHGLNAASLEVGSPAYSSWEENGYAGAWLDATNDWIYRHIFRAIERMIDLAERFPNDTGLKERALNQAARELLLVQGSDWPKMLYRGICPAYAQGQIEEALRNFTTIFEALGSNHLSTGWLTDLERRHQVFQHINFRVFSQKK